MKRNRLRELLEEDEPSLGTHMHSSWPSIIELIGYSGMFDYVEFVGEYAPYDLYALENMGRAVDLFEHMSSMMKIEQEPRTYLTIRAIGSGIQNLLFADVRNVEDVEECVRAVRAESPRTRGVHGVGMRRDVGFVRDVGSLAFVEALDDAVVMLMIEKESAVENLEALLSVEGVDMVNFGPADYSMSIGLTGQFDHPRVKEAERARDRDRAQARDPTPGRDRTSRGGRSLPRHGCEALLHGHRRLHPLCVANRAGQRDAEDPRETHSRRSRRSVAVRSHRAVIVAPGPAGKGRQ